MANPEHFSEKYFSDTSVDHEGSYYGRTLSAAVKEMQDGEKYHALRLPIGSSGEKIKQIDALHVITYDAADNTQFLQFYPNDSKRDNKKLLSLAKQEIDLHQVQVELDYQSYVNMIALLRNLNLNVLGGIRIGTLVNDMPTVELVYPRAFAEITGDERLGADMTAAYMQVVYDALGKTS